MKPKLILGTCGLALILTGCLHPKIGPQSLPRDRAAYSVSLADSWKEQTLLNIVKMRYIDPPIFVDVGNIVASQSLVQGVSANGRISPSGTGSGASAATIGGFGTYSNTPTITYTPLTGNKFIKGLMTPLPPGQIFSAIQSGLAADKIIFATVSSINGLKNQDAHFTGIQRADPEFHRVRELMRDIQLSGAIRASVTLDANKEEATVLVLRNKNVSPEILAKIIEMRKLLGLNPDATEFKVVSGAIASNDTEVAVTTRSILGLMQTMAAQVEVPPEDLQRHLAFPGFETEQQNPAIHRLIRVHSGKKRPEGTFVAVSYLDNWFWIDNGDLETKQVFSLMMMLFTMADTGERGNLPVVTIPAH